MKNYYFALLIMTFSFLQSQTFEGTIYFKDNTSKSGLISYPTEITKGKVKFKTGNNPVQEFEISDVKKLDYIISQFYPIEHKKNYLLTKKIIDNPKVNLYVFESVDNTNYRGLNGFPSTLSADTYVYFIEMDNKKPEVIASWYDKGITTFIRKANVKYILKYFRDKCPEMEDAYKTDKIKYTGNPAPFIEYYINNCSKN